MTSKLKGFLGFRGKAVVRLQCNANRFQQGRLLMNFFAQKDINVNHWNAIDYATVGVNTLIYQTQLPRVEFDPSMDTDVILEVPYITDNLYYNLLTGEGSMGSINITVYSPLVDPSGTGSVNYTLYTHFEDVELVFPAYPSGYFTQSGLYTQGAVPRKRNPKVKASADRNPEPSVAEQQEANVGPISGAFTAVSKAANELTAIPIISSIAGTVSWVAGAISDVASFFGFSNPLNNSPTTNVLVKTYNNAINATGVDNSYNFGVIEDNCVAHLPGFAGSDEDEMTISKVISIPAYFTSFTWSTSTAAGTSIFQQHIGPNEYYATRGPYVIGGQTGVYLQDTIPLTYVSQAFSMYKGSIKYVFKIVKTEFHSGRLMVCYSPGTQNTGDIVYTNTAYVHREVIDVRESTEFTFVAPYANLQPYMNSLPISTHQGYTDYGYISIFVLNELIAPVTVNASVTILVEACAADDFEFARPSSYVPTLVTNAVGVSVPSNNNPLSMQSGLYFQAGDTVSGEASQDSRPQPIPKSIGNSSVVDDSMTSSMFCVGEKIVSFRSLLKRAVPFAEFTPSSLSASWFYLYPWLLPISDNASPIAIISNGLNLYTDYMSFICPMYGLMRGSVRLKILNLTQITPAGTQAPFQGSFNISPSTTFASDPYVATLSTSAAVPENEPGINVLLPSIPYQPTVHPNPEFQVPYYSTRHASVPMLIPSSVGLVNQYHQPQSFFSGVLISPSSSTQLFTITISRQIGEDFSLGNFLTTLPFTDARSSNWTKHKSGWFN
jgi:hypothetical protein